MSAVDPVPGPILIGIDGGELSATERESLQHPAVGGVVLFARNYAGREQLRDLTRAIREAAHAPMLICVDHEGGQVQRFRTGFTRLPALAVLGRMYLDSAERARDFAYRHGRVMATELLLTGIDLSFAPVLDLDVASHVIGKRAFSPNPDITSDLGAHYLAGMHDAGMKACGKHFPGHGSIPEDSHLAEVRDERPLEDIESSDLEPFRKLLPQLESLMMAHVSYPAVDGRPAGFSPFWIQEYLRGKLAWRGTVLSDDLGMQGAAFAGTLADRARLALGAGCDAVLVCDPEEARTMLALLDDTLPGGGESLVRLTGKTLLSAEELAQVPEWAHWQRSLEELETSKWA